MSADVFLDTNILLYVADRRAGDKCLVAARLFRELCAKRRATVSTQVLQETYVNLVGKLGFDRAQARAFLARLERLPLQLVTRPIIYRGIEVSERYQLSFWDSVLLASATEAGCRVLLTEDLQDGLRVGNVTVRNPFVA